MLTEVNNVLHADNCNVMFVAVPYTAYVPETGSLTYASGGHCAPLVVHADRSCTELPGTDGVVPGFAADGDYTRREAAPTRGETLIMYSDGLTEASNSHGSKP